MDKVKHFFVCFFATAIGAVATFYVGKLGSILCGAFLALGLGVGKEYGDSKASGNKWDWLDIVADVAGIAFAVICLLIAWRD